MVTSFYFDAEAAARTLQFTERLLADEAWVGRQAVIRDITADSVRRELTDRVAHTERYLEKKASAHGMTGPEYRRVVEGRMRRVRSAAGYEKLLPSSPFRAQISATATVGAVPAPACERRPRMQTWVSNASVTVSGDNVTATYSASHNTDRPADQRLNMTWWHNQWGPTGIATPSRRQLSICRDYATAEHEQSWNRCSARSPATADARSGHVTSDVRYGGRTLITRGSHASDSVTVRKSGCGGGDGPALFEADPFCISGYRANTGECCDQMIYRRGELWCVIIN